LIINKDAIEHYNLPKNKGKLLKHTEEIHKLEHSNVMCLRLLVLDDGL
jgi:hypothetical protein